MSEFGISGPLGKAYLRDKVGTRPVRWFVGLRLRRKRRSWDFTCPQQCRHPFEFGLIETCPGMSDVGQRTRRFVMHAEQQRTKVRPRVSRLGPSADDELLFMDDLSLPPRRAPPP
jgi:hypothetical protein